MIEKIVIGLLHVSVLGSGDNTCYYDVKGIRHVFSSTVFVQDRRNFLSGWIRRFVYLMDVLI